MEKVEGDKHGQFAKNLNEKVGQNMSLQVGQNLQEKSGQKLCARKPAWRFTLKPV